VAALPLKSGLGPIRALVPAAQDRREQLQQAAGGGRIFEGCYLVGRRAVDPFWAAVDESRSALGDLPILGSGPWAAYSFCDVVLRPVSCDSKGW
jgi:Gas vesicle synthesis protein GvpL/GvpF